MTIYEIDKAIAACLDAGTEEAVDMETGEILRLDALEMERSKKLENVACYIKNLSADADAIKAEKDALVKREQEARKKVDKLKEWLANQLQGAKLTTPVVPSPSASRSGWTCWIAKLSPTGRRFGMTIC